MLRRLVVVGTSLTSVGAAASALAASVCCLGPAAISMLGVGGAVAAAGLRPYRSVLLLGSLALLAAGFWLSYRPLALGSWSACSTRAGRVSRTIVWIAASIWLASVLTTYVVNQ